MSVFRSLVAIAATIATLTLPALAAPYLGPETPEPVRLNTTVTINGPSVHLGDVFTGLTAYQDRVVAKSPRPGQREVLAPDFLANLARSYSFDWQPTDQYDRAVVFRPGQTVTPTDILEALKADLELKGLPEHFGLRPAGILPTLTVPADATPPVVVREAFFDANSKAFSAVLEIAGGDNAPQFLQMRGVAFATVSVPVLKEDTGRTTVITSEMVEQMDVPEEQVRANTITDESLLIGMSPRAFLQAHRPIHSADVGRVSLVDVPVLKNEMRRDGVITDANIVWTTVNAADLPNDVVVSKDYLIGKSPRSLVAGGAPIRRGDVLAVRQVAMAVAARDISNGVVLQKGDINWVPVGDNDVNTGVVTSEALITGRATTRPIRAGQALRTIDLVRPIVIHRGKLVTIVYMTGTMKLTVQGEAMEDGAQSETIRVANAKSKTTVLAEVLDTNTVRVSGQQVSAIQ